MFYLLTVRVVVVCVSKRVIIFHLQTITARVIVLGAYVYLLTITIICSDIMYCSVFKIQSSPCESHTPHSYELQGRRNGAGACNILFIIAFPFSFYLFIDLILPRHPARRRRT
jgi:hypothetical protein